MPFSHRHQPFTDYRVEDFKSLISTNLEGFLYVTELFRSRRQSLSRKRSQSYRNPLSRQIFMEFTRFGFDETLEVIKGIIIA